MLEHLGWIKSRVEAFGVMGTRMAAWARMGMHGRAWCVYTLPRLKMFRPRNSDGQGKETRVAMEGLNTGSRIQPPAWMIRGGVFLDGHRETQLL